MREYLYVVRRRKMGHEKGFAVIGAVMAKNKRHAYAKALKKQWHQVCYDGFVWPVTEFPEIIPHYKACRDYREVWERDADRRAGRPANSYFGRRIMAAIEKQMKEARRGRASLNPMTFYRRSAMRESLNRY